MSNHDYHVISWGSSWVMPWLQPLPYSLAVPLTSVAPLNWWHHLHLQRMELDEDVGWRVGWIWPSSSTTNHPKTKENNSLRSFVVHALLCLCLEQVLFSSFQFDMAQSWEAIMVQPLPLPVASFSCRAAATSTATSRSVGGPNLPKRHLHMHYTHHLTYTLDTRNQETKYFNFCGFL